MNTELIARICHEVNRAYCISIGDESQVSWDDAPEWQKESAVNGVEHAISQSCTPMDLHSNWMALKLEQGWTYGPAKCVETKTHPCLVPYDQLPENQRTKDLLFLAVVDACKSDIPF